MKLIIDIPEDVYTRLFDSGIQDNEIAVDDVCEMARALRMGTPLPTENKHQFIMLPNCPSCGNCMWKCEDNKMVCAVCGYIAERNKKE